jgi:FixJ family two-component response regulator
MRVQREGYADPYTGGRPIPKYNGRPRCTGACLCVCQSNVLLVSVVDDDESVRESLPDLLKEFGYQSRVFSSAEEFLVSDCVDQTKCLILDIAMPGMTGPELQQELKLRRQEIPVIFITASRDESVRAQLLEKGAVDCLFKPFGDTAMFEALQAALKVR